MADYIGAMSFGLGDALADEKKKKYEVTKEDTLAPGLSGELKKKRKKKSGSTEDVFTADSTNNVEAMKEGKYGLQVKSTEGTDGTTTAETGTNWQGALGDAVKFLASNKKVPTPPPPQPGNFAGRHSFDGGSFYGALNTNPFPQLSGGFR